MDDGLLNTYGVLKKQELLLHRNDSFVIIVLYYHKLIFCQAPPHRKISNLRFFQARERSSRSFAESFRSKGKPLLIVPCLSL